MTDGRFGRLTDPPASFVLVGPRVIDPAGGDDGIRDLAVRDGLIAESDPPSVERIDARGMVVAPGLCDLHVHLREPGTEGETIESGARAAARGGFTTICAMPNTVPALDDPGQVRDLLDRARSASCRVRVIGAATRGRAGEEPADLEAMAGAGVAGFSDDGAAVTDRLLTTVLERIAATGLPLLEHAEDAALAAGSVMRAGPTVTRLGLVGWAPEAEVRCVERDIALAEQVGTRLHLTHLSTSGALAAVRRAKGRGLPVTCDVTPHHLALTDAWVGGSRKFAWEEPDAAASGPAAYDGATRVNPPLASREDALALLEAVEDGTVDAIATDHAPHPPHRKLVPFAEAAPGLIGLETALSLGLAASDAGRLSLGRLVPALSSAPAGLIGEPRGLHTGAVADLVLFDPAPRRRLEANDFASASRNSPLIGMDLPGVVRLTVADGRVTYRS